MSDRSMAQFLEKSSSHRCQRFYMLYLGACTLLLYYVKGQVELSPSVVALVCEAGDQLELACNSSSSPLHTWQFTAISECGAAMTYDSAIQSTGPIGVLNPQPLTINSTTVFTFSRLSNQNDLPLISRVIINNVSKGLNGVEINCTDARMVNSATTTIHIIGDVQTSKLSIQLLSERLNFSDRVTAVLKWTLSSSLIQYPQLLLNASVSIVPDSGVEMLLLGNASVQLTLLYNTLYNVSILQPATCEQLSQKAFIELKYSKCSDPLTLVNASVIVDGYEDPALEGENIMFSCPTGLMMTGPNSATCMGNGEWEPDPREVVCTATCSSPLYVLQINDSIRTIKETPRSNVMDTRVCCSGLLITKTNTTMCLQNGEWELETTQMISEDTEMPDLTTTAMLRAALISVVCLSILISAVMFAVGVVCGHCIGQRWRVSTASKSSATNEQEEDLELKENVAYITLQPK